MIEKLNNFKSKNEQDIFLQGLIDVGKPSNCKKRMSDVELDSKSKSKKHKFKTNIFSYRIEYNNRQNVCRAAFQSFYGISKKRVERLSTLKSQNRSPQDMRGKSAGSRNKLISGEVCQKIHSFVDNIPVNQVHYSNTIKKYLSSQLNVKIMYTMFMAKHPECQNVKYKFFLKYFHENFNLSFGRPQIDVCSKCEELGVKLKDPHLNDTAKRVVAAELMVHKRRAKKYFAKIDETRKLCKENEKVAALCFDYMQNLPLPFLPVQEIFYYRQLWVNEFCIHNFTTEKATFYSYHEGEGHKGPDEVCSFLNDYINNKIPENVQELHLFCDGCPGQNRNNTMIRYLLALVMTNKFQKITIYFPQRGHSFNDCDRDFGTVKRKIRRLDRIFSVEDYEDLIVSSSTNKKFDVRHITHVDVTGFKKWWPDFFKKKVLSTRSFGKEVPKEEKVSFSINSYYEFSFYSEYMGVVFAKPYIGSIVEDRFLLSKILQRGSSSIVVPDPQNFPAYQGKIPINIKKIEDIKKLQQYIPDMHKAFYNNICEWPTTTGEETEEN